MTPLIVVFLLAVVLIGIAAPLMRRSRRDWLATRDYHRALDTLGQLNESVPAGDQAGSERPAADVVIPSQTRRARELEAAQAYEELRSSRRNGNGAKANGTKANGSKANGDGARSNGKRHADQAEVSGDHYPIVEADADTGSAVGGVRVLGSRSPSARRDVPADRSSSGTTTASVGDRRGHPEPTAGPDRNGTSARSNGAVTQRDRTPGPAGGSNGSGDWVAEIAAKGGPDYQPSAPVKVPDSEDASLQTRDRRAAGRPVVVFGAEDEPPGRNKALAPAGATVMVRPAHLRRRRRRVRKALLTGGAVVVVAAVAVGGLEATGGLGGKKQPTTPIALKRPPVHKVVALPTTTIPTTTLPPAPTTTVAPFTLVSNTGGTATYHVNAPGSTVVLSATAPCWVDAHQANEQGSSVFTQTMSAGQTETLHSPVWIRFGLASAVNVSVNGAALPALGTPGDPYNLQLQ